MVLHACVRTRDTNWHVSQFVSCNVFACVKPVAGLEISFYNWQPSIIDFDTLQPLPVTMLHSYKATSGANPGGDGGIYPPQ